MIKKWCEMTPKEIYQLKRNQCSKCYYFSKTQGNHLQAGTCDYLAIEGHSRGCNPLECKTKEVFTPQIRNRRRTAIDKLKGKSIKVSG